MRVLRGVSGLHEDAVARVTRAGQCQGVADLAFDRDVGDQTVVGFVVGAGLVAGVGVAVGVAVGDVEQEHGVVADSRVQVGLGHGVGGPPCR